jgi:hypothetical protein
LAHQTIDDFEVVVVDDGSDPPIEPPIGWGPRLRVVRGASAGPGKARNLGVGQARGEVVAFTDDDTIPSSQWVEAAVSGLAVNPGAVGIEGPTMSPPFDFLYEHSIVGTRGAYVTANIAFRATVLRDLGGFDEVFTDAHCEDLDLAFRALHCGMILWSDEMEVQHPPRPIATVNLIRRARMIPSEVELLRRHPDRYPGARGIPVRLRVVVRLLRRWGQLGWRDRHRLMRSPRRTARFATVVIGQLVVGAAAVMRASVAARDTR